MIRRISILLLAFALLCPLASFADQSKPPLGSQIDWGHPLSKGIVGCWLMNEGGGNIVKDFAEKNTGTLSGGSRIFNDTSFTAVAGNKVDFGNSATLCGTEITLVFYGMVNTLSSSANTVLIERPYTSAIEPYYSYRLVITNTAAPQPSRIGGQVTLGGSRKSIDPSASVPQIQLGKYFFGAMTHKSGSQIVYYNGVPVISATNTGSMNNYSTNTVTGQSAIFPTNGLIGRVKFIYIYNRALTSSEIQQLYYDPYCFIKKPTLLDMFIQVTAPATYSGWVNILRN